MRRVGTNVCDMYTSLFVALESGHGCSPESAGERENICVAVWRIKKMIRYNLPRGRGEDEGGLSFSFFAHI